MNQKIKIAKGRRIETKAYRSQGLSNFMISNVINSLDIDAYTDFIENDLKPNLGKKREFYIGQDRIIGQVLSEPQSIALINPSIKKDNEDDLKLLPCFVIGFRIIDTRKKILTAEAFLRRTYFIITSQIIVPKMELDKLSHSDFDKFNFQFNEKEVIDIVLERGLDLVSKGILSKRKYTELLIAKYLKII